MEKIEIFLIISSVIQMITVLAVVLNFTYVKINIIHYGKRTPLNEIINNMHKGLLYLLVVNTVVAMMAFAYYCLI